MNTNYYALFLDGESSIEKYITLIKYICSPKSRSLPHITLRLFREPEEKLDYIHTKKISYLDIIEPGAFNLEERESSYVVYLRCESEELEEIDYRPDFPFSRLHITLYNGEDREFAISLLGVLLKWDWHFRLTFLETKDLSLQRLGEGTMQADKIKRTYRDIFGSDNSLEAVNLMNNVQKLNKINKILEHLTLHLSNQKRVSQKIKSIYSDKEEPLTSRNFVDESKKSSFRAENEQTILYDFPIPTVNKPVQDAIYVTPPEYARDMAKCALEAYSGDRSKIRFGDSAIGTGALFIALKRLIDTENKLHNANYSFDSAIGVDIDMEMAKEAFMRYSKRNLKVIYGDAISPNIDLDERRNMMIVNPPYNRHEEIPEEYRTLAKNCAREVTGIEVPANAGLHIYHLLIMDKWLESGGVAVWLLPSTFLQTRYGLAARRYLTENVQLLRLHVYNETELQFDAAKISTAIVVFRKVPPVHSNKVIVSYGNSVDAPMAPMEVDSRMFVEEIDNWRSLIFHTDKRNAQTENKHHSLTLSSLFDIKRGIATGANSFFVLERSEASNLGIPELALKPILPKSRYIQSLTIESEPDGYPALKPQLVMIDCDLEEHVIRNEYPLFYEYLQSAKKGVSGKKAIIDHTLVKERHPWYKQENRTPPPFLLTYMGRQKKDLPPLYFLLNKSNAVALNTYLLLYPHRWLDDLLSEKDSLYEQLLGALNEFAAHVVPQQTRMYSGGLQKLEPNELKKLEISNLPEEVILAYEQQ